MLSWSYRYRRYPPISGQSHSIGWRGLLVIGVLPALLVFYIRRYVKEPEIWAENRAIQREQRREVRAPLFDIFKLNVLGNTLNACWWMASGFVIGYSIGGLFPTYPIIAFFAINVSVSQRPRRL